MLVTPAFIVEDEFLTDLVQKQYGWSLLDKDMIELTNCLNEQIDWSDEQHPKAIKDSLSEDESKAIDKLVNFLNTPMSTNMPVFIRIMW